MLRVLLAGFLLAHAFILVSFLAPAPAATAGAPPWPFRLDRSWLLNRLRVETAVAEALGRAVVGATVAAFVVAAVALAVGVPWWGPATVFAAVLSTVQLSVWFHWWLPLGIVINVVLTAAVLGQWPVLLRLVA